MGIGDWSIQNGVFSQMRSKGSRFTLGSGGWGCVRQTLRNRAFAWGHYGRAYSEFCNNGHFWRFQTSRSLVSRGRRGTLWHSNMFHNVSKVVLCGKRDTSASFQEDELHVSWQAQHFGDLHRHFAWQAQHFRRVVLLFFADRMLGLRQVAHQVQFPGQALHFARCDENWWKMTEASNETSILMQQIWRFIRIL